MKYLAFLLFAFSICCFVSCVDEESQILEQEVIDQKIDTRSNYLCVSSNPSQPNTNCGMPIPAGFFDVNSVLLPNGMCEVTIEISPTVGRGEYCALSINGIHSSGDLPVSGTGVGTSGPLPATITFVLDNPGRFVFNVEAEGLPSGCWSEVFMGC